MADAVICEPIRTPIGRYAGMFKSLTAVELGVAALQGLLERTGLANDEVEDVILGHCYPSMEARRSAAWSRWTQDFRCPCPACSWPDAAGRDCRP
jgi:acetyl-CoA acetyltransferase